MLRSISPIDGRYASKTKALQDYFSEFALIKYRVKIEVAYLIKLIDSNIPQLSGLKSHIPQLTQISDNFSEAEAQSIKETEKITNHDVKAVEYFIKDKMEGLGLSKYKEWVHFALTSQDINNSAIPLSLKDYLDNSFYPELNDLITKMKGFKDTCAQVPILSRTHGQAASPSTVGKEIAVFLERLEDQLSLLKQLPIKAKFGGATGNFNAHKVALPDIDWITFADELMDSVGLVRSHYTTQIAHYDHLAAICHNISRINTILLDFARDIWTYVSMDYFKQKVVANEVGSSAMPHKVNPIDFENAEGNLGIANSIFEFLARKLPVSRLQRDLTDSTVTRNLGVPFAHTSIAFKSLVKGISKLELNKSKLEQDLENNWAVISEAIQNILRRENYPKPYEALKALTRGNSKIDKESIRNFIEGLDVNEDIKQELRQITPHNYIGYA